MTPRTLFGRIFAILVGIPLMFVIFWSNYALYVAFLDNPWLAILIAIAIVVVATYLYYHLVMIVSLVINMRQGGGQAIDLDDEEP